MKSKIVMILIGGLLCLALAASAQVHRASFGSASGFASSDEALARFNVGRPLIGQAANDEVSAEFGYTWQDEISTGIDDDNPVSYRFQLEACFPNPFNPVTTINFGIAEAGPVQLCIYSVDGRRVRILLDSVREPGHYEIQWDGSNDRGGLVSSGVYLYRLETTKQQATRRMILLK